MLRRRDMAVVVAAGASLLTLALLLAPWKAQAACNSPPNGPVYTLMAKINSGPSEVCVNQSATYQVLVWGTNRYQYVANPGHMTSWTADGASSITQNGDSVTVTWADGGSKTVKADVTGTDTVVPEGPCAANDSTNVTVIKVEFGTFDHVCTNGPHATHDVPVTITPSPVPAPGVTLTISTLTGTGDAVFKDTVSHSTQLLSSATLTIAGIAASSIMTNMQLAATVGSCVCTLTIFTVYDVNKLTATESLHTVNTTNDTTQVDETNQVCICQTSNDNAIVKMEFTWPTSGADSNKFLWDFVLTNDATPGTEWSDQKGTYGSDPTNSTWKLPAVCTTNREFILRSWYDCVGILDVQYQHAPPKVWVTVVDTPRSSSRTRWGATPLWT